LIRFSQGIQPISNGIRAAARLLSLAFVSLLLLSSAALAQDSAAGGTDGESSVLPRHPLERKALVDPEGALAAIADELAKTEVQGDHRELALLQLARANACRVNADWTCQQSAGAAASEHGQLANDPIVATRGHIAEARASMALQDYTRGEQQMAQAEVLLKEHPQAELSADVDLGYSSLSFSLGKHALAAEYAARGLTHLPDGQGLPMRVRLLRNLARSLAQTGQVERARATLAEAVELAESFVDPKLSAELYLETARLARLVGDVQIQLENGDKVIQLGRRLQNSQLRGLGLEVLGLAELDEGRTDNALQHLQAAHQDFRELALARDELRVGRQLLNSLVERNPNDPSAAQLMLRLIQLDDEVIRADRARAAEDFEARLKYAEQQNDLLRLEGEAKLAEERARNLNQQHRLSNVLVALSAVILVGLIAFMVQQRRSNQKLRLALEAKLESQSQAGELLALSAGFVCLHDPEGKLLMVNPAVAEAVGEPTEAIVGKSVLEFVRGAGRREWDGYLQQMKENGQVEGTLTVDLPKVGTRHWRYTSRLSPPDLPSSYVIGHAVDVTEQIEQSRALREQSLRDALTGSFNRRYLEIFERRHGSHSDWAVVNIDLDAFKLINDTHGHEHGDQVLKDQARFFQQRMLNGDAVVRVGGDEFVLLLGRADQQSLDRVLGVLSRDAEHSPCAYSVGSALREEHEPLSATLARADDRMYSGRQDRRGTKT